MQIKLQQMLDDSVDAGNPGVILELEAPTRGIRERLSAGHDAADMVDAVVTTVLHQQ